MIFGSARRLAGRVARESAAGRRWQPAARAPMFFSTTAKPEAVMEQKLREGLETTSVHVEDVSGGCGAMYKIEVEAAQFKGQSTLKQQRMVTALLKEEISAMHGYTLVTREPSS